MSRRNVLASVIYVAITGLLCAGLAAAAALAPAPPDVVPMIVLIVVGAPMMAVWHLAGQLTRTGATGEPSAAMAIAQLRRSLDALPEAEHPLGL